jgi:hypothetical protein
MGEVERRSSLYGRLEVLVPELKVVNYARTGVVYTFGSYTIEAFECTLAQFLGTSSTLSLNNKLELPSNVSGSV